MMVLMRVVMLNRTPLVNSVDGVFNDDEDDEGDHTPDRLQRC